MHKKTPRYLRADSLMVDLLEQRASIAGEPLAMSAKSFALLVTLMQSPQTLVAKDAIFAEVWPHACVGDAALTTTVKGLRQALNDTARAQYWIQTVRGQRYRFRKLVEREASDGAPLPTQTKTALAEDRSIVVLPFSDMSSDGDQEYLSNGISEEILNALAKVPDLPVAGRTSSFAYRKQSLDIRLIGEALSVSHVLEGSVRKQGDRVRITAQLVHTTNGFHLWSEVYNGRLDDIFDLQESIALKITDALQLLLGRSVDGRPPKSLTANSEATLVE